MKYLVMETIEVYGIDQTGCLGVFDTSKMAQAYIDDILKEYDANAWIEAVECNPTYK